MTTIDQQTRWSVRLPDTVFEAREENEEPCGSETILRHPSTTSVLDDVTEHERAEEHPLDLSLNRCREIVPIVTRLINCDGPVEPPDVGVVQECWEAPRNLDLDEIGTELLKTAIS